MVTFQLKCSVQWTTDANSNFDDPVTAKLAVEVSLSTNRLHLTEGKQPGKVTLQSTVPLGCTYQ